METILKRYILVEQDDDCSYVIELRDNAYYYVKKLTNSVNMYLIPMDGVTVGDVFEVSQTIEPGTMTATRIELDESDVRKTYTNTKIIDKILHCVNREHPYLANQVKSLINRHIRKYKLEDILDV
jgi:hypothetical protein